jgi:hypothetical protein
MSFCVKPIAYAFRLNYANMASLRYGIECMPVAFFNDMIVETEMSIGIIVSYAAQRKRR